MAPPIIEALNDTVFVNDSILASDLFTVDNLENVETFLFEDFSSFAGSGFFQNGDVAFENGSRFTIAASELENLRYIGAPNVTFEGFRVIAFNAAGESSNPRAIGRIYSTRANTTTPFVVQPSFDILTDEVVNGPEFISGFDPDGFPIVSFTITEGSKVLSLVANNGFATVTSYLHNFETSDSITIRGATNDAFNVTANVAVLDEHRFRFRLPGVTGTASGDIIAAVNDASFFLVNGVQQEQGVPFTVAAENVDQVQYVGNGFADLKNIHLSGFDGVDTSFEKRGLITQRQNVNRPVVQFGRFSTPAEQDFALEDALTVFDADGSTIKQYRFFNTSPHEQNGDLFIHGVRQPKVTWIQIDAEDLSGVTFSTPRVGFEQQIRVAAGDGRFWSSESTISISSTTPIRRPELEANSRQVITEQLREIPVSPLFSQIDDGTAHTRFQVYEGSTLPNSGQLRLGPTVLAADQIHELSAAQYNSRLNFASGEFFTRQIDTVFVRANNDQSDDWSSWVKVDVNTEPEFEDVLTSGTSWNGILPRNADGKLEISYSFMQSFPDYNTGDATDGAAPQQFGIFTEAQRVTAREWFRHTESFANVQFVEVPDSQPNVLGQLGGIMRMGNYGLSQDQTNALAFAFFPSTAPEGGDMWFNRFPPENTDEFAGWRGPFVDGFNQDEVSGLVFIHELGHALGLKHPFAGIPRLPPEADVNRFTVMATSSFAEVSATYGFYDILELQRLYGANETFNNGDNVYSIAETFQRRSFIETIWDAGGNDTLSAVGSGRDSVIDLRQGQQSTIGDINENVTIAYDAEIENAIGSRSDDLLVGNSLDNVLFGNVGNDVLIPGAGEDFLFGASGNDQYIWGVGDQNDVVDEQGNNDARDELVIADFPTVDRLDEDFRFTVQGNDLYINLHIDGGALDNSLRIRNQTVIESQVETLTIRGFRIDLANLVSQVSPGVDTFTATGSSSNNGALVVPV